MRFGRGGSAAFSSLVGVAQRCLQIVVTLLVMPTLINAIGQTSFGVWAAAAAVTWMGGMLDLGTGAAVVTDIARSMAANDREHSKRLVTTALWLAAVIAIFEIAGAMLLIPRLAPSEAAGAYLVAVACMALNVPFGLSGALWTGAQKVYVAWGWEALQTIITGATMWALVSRTTDVRWYVAASAGGVVVGNCASLAHFLISHPELRPWLTPPSLSDARRLLARGAPYLLLALGAFLASYSDSIVALTTLGGDGAAVVALGQKAGMTALGLLFVLTQPLWPAFTNAAMRGEIDWIKTKIRSAAFIVISAAVAGSALIILFGGPVIDIWLSGKVTLGHDVLWAIAIWIVIPTLGRIPDVLLNALGIVWFQVYVAIVFGLLAFGMKFVFASAFGAPGILAATGIAYGCTHLPAYLWWIARWMRRG